MPLPPLLWIDLPCAMDGCRSCSSRPACSTSGPHLSAPWPQPSSMTCPTRLDWARQWVGARGEPESCLWPQPSSTADPVRSSDNGWEPEGDPSYASGRGWEPERKSELCQYRENGGMSTAVDCWTRSGPATAPCPLAPPSDPATAPPTAPLWHLPSWQVLTASEVNQRFPGETRGVMRDCGLNSLVLPPIFSVTEDLMSLRGPDTC